jgi:hypothetical protein
MARVAKIPYAGSDELEPADEAGTFESERARRHLESEVRRLQAELLAVRSALKTVCRVCLPYYVEK